MANSDGPVGNLIPEDEWLAKKRPSLTSEFTKGIGRGTDTAQGSLYGAGAAVADQFGANNARNFLEEQQARNTQEAQQYDPAATHSTSQVVDAFKNEGIGAGMHRAGEFAASGLGELVPQVAASVLAYKAGNKLGGKPAGVAATASQNIAQETGSIYDDIQQKTGQRESGTALGFGAGSGLIDTAVQLIPLGKLAGQGLGIGKGFTGVAKDIAVAGLKQMPLEGATEVAQTAIERAAVTSIDPDQQVFTPEGRQEMIDAGAIGMLGGAAGGAGGEVAGRTQQALLKKPENAPQADVQPADVPPQDNPFAAPADEYVSPIDHHVQKNVEAAAAVDPNAGVLSKVVSMGAQTGAVAEAAAKQYAEDPAVQEKAAVDVFDKEVQRQALEEARQAGLPIQKPAQTQIDFAPPEDISIEDQIARAVQAQHEATGKAPNSDQLAKAFNVSTELAANIRQSVLASLAPPADNVQSPAETDKAPTIGAEDRFPSIFKANQVLKASGLKDTHRAWNDGSGKFAIVPNDVADQQAAEYVAKQAAAPAATEKAARNLDGELEAESSQLHQRALKKAKGSKPAPKYVPKEGIAGDKIDNEWTSFNEKTGTLGIPRAEMPQVKAEHRGALVNFLNGRGVKHKQQDVPASDLKPTQAEFSPEKVDNAKDYQGGDRSILVSSDNHVLDGHHQWLAKHDTDEEVKTIKLDAPIAELIDHVKEFPSVETSSESPAASNPRAESYKLAMKDSPHGKAYGEFIDWWFGDTSKKETARRERVYRLEPGDESVSQLYEALRPFSQSSFANTLDFGYKVPANILELLGLTDDKEAVSENQRATAKATEAVKPSAPSGIDGFVAAKHTDNKMAAGKARNTLGKQIKDSNGKVSSKAEWVERKISEGGTLTTKEEDKIKPMSRMQYFRADNHEQEAHEKRIKEAGKKTVYRIESGGAIWEISKTEYDYANYLKNLAPSNTDQYGQDLNSLSERGDAWNAKLKAMSDEDLNALYEAMNLAGGKNIDQLAALQQEHPDDLDAGYAKLQEKNKAPADPFEALFAAGSAKHAQDAQIHKDVIQVLRNARDASQKSLEDWGSRQYKKNGAMVDLHGDGPKREGSMSISAINEGKRRKAIESLGQEVSALDGLLKKMADHNSAEQFLYEMTQLMEKAGDPEAIANSGIAKTQGELFEYWALDQLKMKPVGGGSYKSNAVSRALLQAIKIKQAVTEKAAASVAEEQHIEVGNKPEAATKKKLQRKPKEETKQELPTDKWRSNRVLATQEATKNGVDVSGLDLPAAVASIERKLADDAALSQPPTDYSQYSGLSVDVPAVDADTGAVGTATIHDAEAELIELEQRERSLDALLRCLSSKA